MGNRGRYEIATAIRTACIWEATSRKVGNVHRYADFAETTYLGFVLSAGEISDRLAGVFSSEVQMRKATGRIGAIISEATWATSQVALSNTNLGMILLLAPLAGVWVEPGSGYRRRDLELVLSKLSVEDTRRVYEAIRLARPGGLGEVPDQDVKDEPLSLIHI